MAITPVPPLTDIPPFPALSDRAAGNYNSKAFEFGTHMAENFNDEILAVASSVMQNAQAAELSASNVSEIAGNAGVSAMEALAYRDQSQAARDAARNFSTAVNATSATTNSVGVGSKSWAGAGLAGKQFSVGQVLLAVNPANVDQWVSGAVTAYSSNDSSSSITLNVTKASPTTAGNSVANWWFCIDAAGAQGGGPLGTLNARLVASAAQKIKAGSAKLVCVGDSLTYGHDQFSSDRVAPVLPHVQPRVPVPFPAQLAAQLNAAYSTTGISVENRGYSGDTAKMGYVRWPSDPGADLAIIMFGANDAADVGGATLEEFTSYLGRLIERYNAWGCGVVIVTPTVMNQGGESRNIMPYRTAAALVGQQYGCPVIRGEEIGLGNKRELIYSDSIHFNTQGYRLLGNAVATFILAGGITGSHNVVANERSILLGSAANVATNGAYSYSTSGSMVEQGMLLTLVRGTGQRVTLGFYLDADAALISLSGTLSTGMAVEFDMDGLRSAATRKTVNADTSDNYTTLSESLLLEPTNTTHLGKVIGRGWHSVSLSAPTGGSSNAVLSALNIKPVRQIECVGSVFPVAKREFSLFDPPIKFDTLPPASTLATFTIDRELFGSVSTAKPGLAYYQSSFAIISIRGLGSNVSFTQYMLTADSVTTYRAVPLFSFGANPVTITSVTGPVGDLNAGEIVINLNRPQANYIEIRIEVPDIADLKSAALI